MKHEKELLNEAEYLLGQIKRSYNIHNTSHDEEVLKHIRGSLIEYSEHMFQQHKKAKVKVRQHG